MLDLLLYLSYVGAVYGIIKVIFDMSKKRKWDDIRKSHEFFILLISVIVVTCFFIPWDKFHYGDEKPKIIYVRAPLKTTDTLKSLPIKVQKETIYIATQKLKPIPRDKPILEVKKAPDTTKAPSKYDLSHANLDHSAVGDNSSVTNMNGIKQRHLTDAMLSYITIMIGDKSANVSIQTVPNDAESLNLADEIYYALVKLNYHIVARGTFYQAGRTPFDKVLVHKNSEKDYSISVYPSSNVQ